MNMDTYSNVDNKLIITKTRIENIPVTLEDLLARKGLLEKQLEDINALISEATKLKITPIEQYDRQRRS